MKWFRFILFPFAVVYDLVTTIRNFFFNTQFFKTTTFSIPIIAVGNLSVGGTGKTPQIEYLTTLLKDSYKLAILSRGYKRKTKGFVLLNTNSTAEQVGDEPLQFFKKFKDITVVVDANRVNGINKLLAQQHPPEVILLDDAFQHRKVTASFYILLTKYTDLYVNDFLLPTGNLRESKRGAKRAHIIVVTKCPPNLSKTSQQKIIKALQPKAHQQIYFSTITYSEKILGKHPISIVALKKYTVLLITGIANPNPLLAFLTKNNVNFIHLQFADHHHFSKKELQAIQLQFNKINTVTKLILTTEKDFVRLENKLENLYYLPIKTTFLTAKKEFDTTIKNHIKS